MCYLISDYFELPTEMYLIRYVNVQTRNGYKAFDVFETMNRQAYFRTTGEYRYDASSRNIESLMRIRAQEIGHMEAGFYDVYHSEDNDLRLRCIGPQRFWATHGVQVDMSHFYAQQQEIEAQAIIEDAHLLWNLWDDDERLDPVTDNDSTSSLSEEEEERLMTQDIGPLDPADAIH